MIGTSANGVDGDYVLPTMIVISVEALHRNGEVLTEDPVQDYYA